MSGRVGDPDSDAVRKTVVKTYGSRGKMARGVESMAGKGYEIAQQSGEFPTWFTPIWRRHKVVVTFRLNEKERPS